MPLKQLTFISNSLGNFWASLIWALIHRLFQIMNQLHHSTNATKSAGLFAANSGTFTRLSALIQIAVCVTMRPFIPDI